MKFDVDDIFDLLISCFMQRTEMHEKSEVC